MNVAAIFSFILFKSQPLLSILELTGAVASVQLAAIFAVILVSIIATISIISLMRYIWKQMTQDDLGSEDEEPDSEEEQDVLEIPILPVDGPQERIQAEMGASGYKPAPKIRGKYYDTLETIVAIHTYRDLCLHIEKTILDADNYSIEYINENNSLIAYLHSPEDISRINVDNIFLELNGRFNVVLKVLKEWDKDCKKIGVLQEHLAGNQGSIFSYIVSASVDKETSFCKYTADFWGGDTSCKLLNCFIGSNPLDAQNACNNIPENFSLLIIMPIALTKYLSMMKNGQHKSEKVLWRTEIDFCDYNEGEVSDNKYFLPCSQKHPAELPSDIADRFERNPHLLELHNYSGGQLFHAMTYRNELEVVVEPSSLIVVQKIKDTTEKRKNSRPYKKIKMIAIEKPAIDDVYLANTPRAILCNLFDKSVANDFTQEKNVNVLTTILEYTGLPSITP